MNIERKFLDANQNELVDVSGSVGFKWIVTFLSFRNSPSLPFFENSLIGSAIILTTQRTV
jgi:hypothetical protein